ncbi:type 1 glutamine amidotransferase [Streptomyces sp. NPDC005438]|uniref:type 1 glutamine amidotransferase n=1 Tax=Streptomyces sp. NPDC005438 TaxID=3156880 RepID=UPI0033B20D60
MGQSPRLLTVQNGPTGGPGRWGDWLAERDIALDVVHGYREQPLPRRLDHDGLLVLGGSYLPDEDDRAPWLAPTRALVDQALERGVPVFGICLGGQMLAQVAGGQVRGQWGTPEFGSTRLELRPEADADPLFGQLPGTVTAIENHVDQITELPAEAHWLASSEHCPHQAFRVGDTAWGVQFHPEAGAQRLAHWGEERLNRHGVDREELRRAAERDEPTSEPVWRQVADRFAAQVRERSAA